MLPDKTYVPEDILQLARDRWWWLLLPLSICAAAAAVAAEHVVPLAYRSDALILVTPQQLSSAYVNNTVNTPIQDRLQASAQTILSRTQLEALIDEYDLYAEERQTVLAEDVFDMMKRQIDVVPLQRGETFRVSFTHKNPRVAQQVTDRLATLFIDQSEQERNRQATNTSQFFEDMLEDARLQLEQNETALEQFRRDHNGELPEQLEANMQMLQGLQLQIRTTLDSLARDLDRQILLERQLAALESQPPFRSTVEVGAIVPSSAAGPVSSAADLERARAMLTTLRVNGYLPGHPDVRAQEKLVRDLEAKVEAEALATPLSAAGNVGLPPEEIERLRRISDANAELDLLNTTIASKEADIERLRTDVATYERRVNMAPTRDTELIDLTRDYDTLRQRYNSLLDRKEDARIAAQLEQTGGYFQLLDPASLPERPASPDPVLVILLGMAVGLGLGAALIALVEYRDRSFSTDSEVTRILSLPVLAVVPHMQSDRDERRGKRLLLLRSIGFGSVVAGCMAVVAYTFVR